MDVVEQIRQVANIIDIASQYTTLRQRGKKHVGLCPFHSERDPSFTVDPDKQLFHCFGCGAGGDIFSLVMEKESLGFPETVKYLAERYRIPLPEMKKRSPQAAKLEEQIYKINESTLAFFKKNLLNTQEGKKALDYLHQREISDDTISELKIGYAMNSWDSLIKYFKTKSTPLSLLEKAGLILRREGKEGYYDRFRGRIIFPIFTISGKVVAFGGRTAIEDDPKYLNSPDTPVYHKGKLLYGLNWTKEKIREKGFSIMVEGYTDFISLYQRNIQNIAASLGTSVTPDHIALAKRFAPQILVSYDGDDAGKKAAYRAISLCFEAGMRIKIMTIPKGSDPDTYIQKNGIVAFKKLMKESQDGLMFLIRTQTQEGSMDIPEEKSKIVRNTVGILAKIPDPVVRSEYLKLAGDILKVTDDVMRSLIHTKSTKKSEFKQEDFLSAEKRLLQIVSQENAIAAQVFKEMNEHDFKGLKSKPIFQYLSDAFKNGKSFHFNEIKDNLDSSLVSALTAILLEEEQSASIEEALDCLSTLRILAKERQIKKIGGEIAQAEKENDRDRVIQIQKEMQVLTQELMKQKTGK